MITYRERLPVRHGLGRHVNHDARSLAYPVRPTAPPQSVRWLRHAPIFDQGSLGSCTGNAAVGCLGTEPFWPTVQEIDRPGAPDWDEAWAVEVYSLATQIDPWPGAYPPEDTGSDGLSVAKVLRRGGWIAGYEHGVGDLQTTLAALAERPAIFGFPFYSSMYEPAADGTVHIGGTLDGGHEVVVDEVDLVRGRIGLANSWGEGWGIAGRFYMTFETFQTLRGQDADLTFFVPRDAPAPEPTDPTGDPDLAALKAGTARWLASSLYAGTSEARRAVREYLRAKGA